MGKGESTCRCCGCSGEIAQNQTREQGAQSVHSPQACNANEAVADVHRLARSIEQGTGLPGNADRVGYR